MVKPYKIDVYKTEDSLKSIFLHSFQIPTRERLTKSHCHVSYTISQQIDKMQHSELDNPLHYQNHKVNTRFSRCERIS